jgi:hypothetical protein
VECYPGVKKTAAKLVKISTNAGPIIEKTKQLLRVWFWKIGKNQSRTDKGWEPSGSVRS